MLETTLCIIKPDAVGKNLIGAILRMAEEAGFSVVGLKMVRLSRKQAEGFYHVHRGRSFFHSLTAFMCEGPIVVMALRGENAIARWRAIMGATDPAESAEGTIRKLYAENIERNAVHGSDGPETAAFEVGFFFSALERVM